MDEKGRFGELSTQETQEIMNKKQQKKPQSLE